MQIIRSPWTRIEDPLYPWARTIEKIICAHDLPLLSGPVINIFSDYSGEHKASRYLATSVLYIDLEASRRWEIQRRWLRQRFLPDGRRLSYKALGDRQRQRALIPFLEAADLIVGVSVTLVISKAIGSLCITETTFPEAKARLGLEYKWNSKKLEKTLRVVHLVSLLIGGLSHPGQHVYWISDEDVLFANQSRTRDLKRMMDKFTGYYARHKLGELGMGTTAIDPGDRFEEDFTAIPDLVAGAVSEIATRLAEMAGGSIPFEITLPYQRPLPQKTEILASWLWEKRSSLAKIVVLIEHHGKRGFSVQRLGMER